VEAFRKEYPVSVLCETLGVSLSGYYAWKKRPLSQHQREDSQLAERIHAELRDQGITVSRKRVARLMREQGLSASRRYHRTITRHQ
jgi:putative transposase